MSGFEVLRKFLEALLLGFELFQLLFQLWFFLELCFLVGIDLLLGDKEGIVGMSSFLDSSLSLSYGSKLLVRVSDLSSPVSLYLEVFVEAYFASSLK